MTDKPWRAARGIVPMGDELPEVTIARHRGRTDNPPMPVRKITVLECTCTRCGYVWVARGEVPVRCSGCGSVYWNRPYMRVMKGKAK